MSPARPLLHVRVKPGSFWAQFWRALGRLPQPPPEGDCPATWPPEAIGNQMRLYCTLDAGHDGEHEAWSASDTEPYKTWAEQ